MNFPFGMARGLCIEFQGMYIDGDEQMQFFSMFQSREMIHFDDTLPTKKTNMSEQKSWSFPFQMVRVWGEEFVHFQGGG